MLVCFSTNVVAKEILMDCKTSKYRYIKNNSDITILYTHKKRDNGKWSGWCPSKATDNNKNWFISAKDHSLSVSNNRAECIVSEGKFKMVGGDVGIVRSSTSVVDFKKKTYVSEFFWMNEKKKTKVKTKCKIKKTT